MRTVRTSGGRFCVSPEKLAPSPQWPPIRPHPPVKLGKLFRFSRPHRRLSGSHETNTHGETFFLPVLARRRRAVPAPARAPAGRPETAARTLPGSLVEQNQNHWFQFLFTHPAAWAVVALCGT